MESVLLYAIIISCSISALFAGARIYFTYFAKGKCNEEACKDARLVELYCNKEEEVKTPAYTPKKGRKPKNKGESIGDFALDVVSKKKPGRKKKQS